MLQPHKIESVVPATTFVYPADLSSFSSDSLYSKINGQVFSVLFSGANFMFFLSVIPQGSSRGRSGEPDSVCSPEPAYLSTFSTWDKTYSQLTLFYL